jgi:hypothetical protein
MINLNLHNRHPKDLPDKETINDILLELHDTNKFHISWINLNNDWRGNGKFFDNWVERGQVVTCEMDKPLNRAYSDESTNMSYVSVKETRYDIIRHPIRVSVKLKPDIFSLNKGDKEIIDTLTDVYLRLKDYLGPDVIQEQYGSGFDIDFMISDCKIIK